MIDFPPMTEDVSNSIIKANRQTPMQAYKSFIPPTSLHSPVDSSSSQPSFSYGAKTKNAVTPKMRPIAESPGPINEMFFIPGTSFNPVNAKIVIPRTAAVVKAKASITTPGFDA